VARPTGTPGGWNGPAQLGAATVANAGTRKVLVGAGANGRFVLSPGDASDRRAAEQELTI
jgi:hypothetical protein